MWWGWILLSATVLGCCPDVAFLPDEREAIYDVNSGMIVCVDTFEEVGLNDINCTIIETNIDCRTRCQLDPTCKYVHITKNHCRFCSRGFKEREETVSIYVKDKKKCTNGVRLHNLLRQSVLPVKAAMIACDESNGLTYTDSNGLPLQCNVYNAYKSFPKYGIGLLKIFGFNGFFVDKKKQIFRVTNFFGGFFQKKKQIH